MAGFHRGLVITPGTERQLGACGLFRPSPSQRDVLSLPTGPLSVKGADPDMLWAGFPAEPWGGLWSTADYLVLAETFPAWGGGRHTFAFCRGRCQPGCLAAVPGFAGRPPRA